MDYFKHRRHHDSMKRWSGFNDLVEIMEKGGLPASSRYSLEFTIDILNSHNNGNITLDPDFSVIKYSCKSKFNNSINKRRPEDEKELHITEVSDLEGGGSVGYKEISSNDAKLGFCADGYLDVEDKLVFRRSLVDLLGYQKSYIIKEGIDLILMIKNALGGIPEAIASLREVVEKDEKVREIVEFLCKSKREDLMSDLENIQGLAYSL